MASVTTDTPFYGKRRAFPELKRSNGHVPPKVVHMDMGRGGSVANGAGSGNDDEDVPQRVRWRAEDTQQPAGGSGDGTAERDRDNSRQRGRYRLPAETAEQLRSILRGVSVPMAVLPPSTGTRMNLRVWELSFGGNYGASDF
jgi:hypothetical protein